MLVEKVREGIILGAETERIFGIWDTRLGAGQGIEPHFHENFEELYYLLSGRGRVSIGDEDKEVEEGDAIYIPREKVHRILNTSDAPLRFITVTVSVDGGEKVPEPPSYIS